MFFLCSLVHASGDKKIRKVLAAKRTGSRLKAGQCDAVNFLAFDRIKT